MRYAYIRFALLPLAIASASGQAQENSKQFIEEIVVTAQKRSESAQDVPVSISAFSEKMLMNTGANDINAIIPMIPGLTGNNVGIATNAWGIRGISTNDWSVGSEPSVGVFFDDAYIGRNALATGAFFDIERIEVVKGPQGTLFGRNASVGAISIISNKPSDENAFSLGLSAGNEGQVEYNSVANIAVNESFSLRAAVHGKRLEGIWRDIGVGEEAFSDDDSVRIMGRFNPSDDFEALLTLSYSEAETNMGGSYNVSLSTTEPGQEFPDLIATNTGAREDNQTDGVQLRLSWDINEQLSFTSITDRRRFSYNYAQDLDGSNNDAVVNAAIDIIGGGDGSGGTGGMDLQFQSADVEQKSISQEFRINGETENLSWFVGASYFDEDVSEKTIVNLSDTALGLGLLGRDFTPTQGDNKSIGVYGDAKWSLSDDLSISAGIRWSEDKKSWCTNGSADIGLAAVNTGGQTVCGSSTWSEVTPRVLMDYRFADDAMLYVNIAKGYKGGGFNTNAADQNGDGVGETAAEFNPETNLAYETGIKSTWMDGRLRLNGAVFFNGYEDLQIQTATFAGILISNAAQAETKGLELELTAKPSAELTLMFNYTYLDAEFTAGDFKTNRMAYAPESSYSLGFNYDMAMGSGTLSWFTMYNWQGDYYFDAANTPNLEQESYGVLNSRISYSPAGDKWSLAVSVENLSDEEYANIRQDIGLGLAMNRGMPRLWRLDVNYHF